MGKVIGIISIKGGVGKTTISASIASDLAKNYGKKVLLIDANYSAPNLGIHMNITSPKNTIHDVLSGRAGLRSAIHKSYGVDVIPGSVMYDKNLSHFKLKDKIEKFKSEYDFIVLDSSPSMNDEILSTMVASDHLFVVSTPDYPTMVNSLKAAVLAKHRGKNISGIIVNKVRDPNYELSIEEIEDSTNIPVVAKIPDDYTSVRALFSMMPVPIYNKYSAMAKEINKLNGALTFTPTKRSVWAKMFPSSVGKEAVNREILKQSFYESVFEG